MDATSSAEATTTAPYELPSVTQDPPRPRRSQYIDEDHDRLTFRVNRAAFRDPDVFRMEREQIWHRTWLYIGHESEIASPGDFRVRTVGGRSLIFCRDEDGELQVYLNSCPHRGTELCRVVEGNTRFFRCFYHAWTFATDGRLIALPGEDAYPSDSDFRDRSGLRRVPHVESVRGFVFISFNPDVPTLREHLGPAYEYIELVADHSPLGMEVIPGTQRYDVQGNWKLTVENAMDGYHFAPTHITFMEFMRSRNSTAGEVKRVLDGEPSQDVVEVLGNGHCVLVRWGSRRVGWIWEPSFGEEERERIDGNRREIEERLGEGRGRAIADTLRILYVYPNLILFDVMSPYIRMIEPLSPGTTAVTNWELVPKGEPTEARTLRNKELLAFIGPGGLATPDDIEAYEAIQRGIVASARDPRPGVDWNDVSRGLRAELAGEKCRDIDEAGLRDFWRKWDDALSS